MKHVFSNYQECAHVWAQQNQDEGRAGNVFFQKDSIYSYGYHFKMARFLDSNTVLITSKSYSVSTSKHKHAVASAVCHKKCVYIFNIDTDVAGNLSHYISMASGYLEKASVAISKKDYYLGCARECYDTLKTFSEVIKDKSKEAKKALKKLDEITNNPRLDKIRKAVKEQQVRELKAKKARDKLYAEEKAKDLATWLSGASNYINRSISEKCLLRVENDTVETSLGASVPLREAKILYKRIKSGRPVHGITIGRFTVVSYMNGILKIGCHVIEQSEIDRIADKLV